MTKRKTKAQREQEQRAALLRRVVDIYSGGCERSMEPVPVFQDDVTPMELSRILTALRDLLGDGPHAEWWGWEPRALGHFQTPELAAQHLYNAGFRADRHLDPQETT